MNKKILLWIVISLASALCFFASWRFFSKAFPILHVDISMSREAALETAQARAAALKLAPPGARTAIRFATDTDVQNFIELEGGGKDAFLNLIHKDIYQALKWEIRFFREKDAEVSTVYFTPQGKPYGFARHVPENVPGAALDAEQARRIAEAAALRDWNVDLSPQRSPYDLVEKSFVKRPNGRVDHFFTYERRDQRLGKNGEGRVRIDLTVAGDRLVGLQHSVKIPESFQRRFAEMRSANTTIAATGSLAMGFLYILGGCVIGLLLLKRARMVIAKPAVKWAAFVAFLQAAAMLDRIPSAWFDYDTAIPAGSFIGQQVAAAVGLFFGMWLLLSISFMAAESLSRKAFGHQPQLWKLWTQGAGNTWSVLGRTAGGYLWVGFDLLFIVVFYYLTQHYLGWWSPLESLVDPNILATPLPWLTPVANALQAGMWEECLFRAVPLAGAALIGDYLGRRFNGRFGARNTWLVIGLIVEALIFGAGHAAYAQQPSYARPVELFLPAITWGLVYLRFGLLPGIVFHFVFDLLMMSLPIFALNAPGLELDRVIIVACGAMPLLIVFWMRWRAGKWETLPARLLNSGWERKSAHAEEAADTPFHADHGRAAWPRVRAALPWLGAIGLAMWIAFTPFRQDGLPLYLDRAQAENAADAALKERGVHLSPEWKRFSSIEQNREAGDDFVWREGGAAAYRALMGAYLAPPRWKVRYARFDGDIGQRAEQWIVVVENGIDGRGGKEAVPHVRLIDHEIPEAAPGASLTAEEARVPALRAIRETLGYDPAALREISAVETDRPKRKDWRFTFADNSRFPLKTGEARIDVNVAGDEISYVGRSVHVPEEWARRDRERHALLENLKTGLRILSALFMMGVIIAALVRAANKGVDKFCFVGATAVTFMLGLLAKANTWQELAINLRTDQPLAAQLGMMGGALAFGTLIVALIVGMFAGLAAHPAQRGKLGETRFAGILLPSLGLAAAWAGLAAALGITGVQQAAHWESVGLLNQAWPAIGSLAGGVLAALGKLAAVTFLLTALRDFNANFTRRRLLTILILLPVGLSAGMPAADLPSFLIQAVGNSLIIVLMYVMVARFEPKMVLFAAMPSIFAPIATAIIAPYPHAWLYTLLYLLGIAATAAWWMRMLEKNTVPAANPAVLIVPAS